MRNLIVALLIFALQPLSALGQDNERFSQSKITAAEWQQYFEEVRALPDVVIQQTEDQFLITINTKQKQGAYFFTKKAHPAHPAVVRVLFVDNAGQNTARLLGYYAGSKDAFDSWYRILYSRISQSGKR